jgi:8-oxo-dGTP pyrophosphatase MutT (NUDIX family)
MRYLDRVLALTRWDPAAFRPWREGGGVIGYVTHAFAETLGRFPDVFAVARDEVRLRPDLADPGARTAAVARVLRRLVGEGRVAHWRDEELPVMESWGEEPILRLDRGGATAFGIHGFGVHVNGYVREGGDLHLWIARRSERMVVAPGKLDHLVAGGLAAGSTPRETLVREAEEEAGIPRRLAERARPAGIVSYRLQIEEGLRWDTLFVWDLELPADFVPENRDGEVASFERWPVGRALAAVRDTLAFKFNVGPVIIDFGVRHGLLGPEEPGYVEIVRALRS